MNTCIKKSAALISGIFLVLACSSSYALTLLSSGSTSLSKSLALNENLKCDSSGKMDVEASLSPTSFVMQSPTDANGNPVSHKCWEVDSTLNPSFAQCEAATDPAAIGCGDSGQFILEQEVEGNTGVPSNCLEGSVTTYDDGTSKETYDCHVNTGGTKENWVWHLVAADQATVDTFCTPLGISATDCGVAMGTPATPKTTDFPPLGNVWMYTQYKDASGSVLVADFQGNMCHTGTWDLTDSISCSAGKTPLTTSALADAAFVVVNTVNTFNGNSTSGNTPTDFYSSSVGGAEVVDPTQIDTTSITLNGSPMVVLSYSTTSDYNGDGFNDMRVHFSTASYQAALFPNNDCTPGTYTVTFKGTFTDGKAWLGVSSVNVVCN